MLTCGPIACTRWWGLPVRAKAHCCPYCGVGEAVGRIHSAAEHRENQLGVSKSHRSGAPKRDRPCDSALSCAGTACAQAEARACELLAQFGLAERASSEYRELSGGEAQRLMLARGVASGADLLLVDEPTAQLDVHTADTVNARLGALSRQGMIVVVATHDHRTRDAATDVIDLEDYQ